MQGPEGTASWQVGVWISEVLCPRALAPAPAACFGQPARQLPPSTSQGIAREHAAWSASQAVGFQGPICIPHQALIPAFAGPNGRVQGDRPRAHVHRGVALPRRPLPAGSLPGEALLIRCALWPLPQARGAVGQVRQGVVGWVGWREGGDGVCTHVCVCVCAVCEWVWVWVWVWACKWGQWQVARSPQGRGCCFRVLNIGQGSVLQPHAAFPV